MKTGQKVIIISDNENYIDFLDKELTIESVCTSSLDNPFYDEGMNGMPLYEFYPVNGIEVPFALYDYEVERVV